MIEEMPRPRLPHLRHEKTRHGKWAWYVRVGNGPRLRLQAPFGTPEFHAQYNAALAGRPEAPQTPPSKDTLRWLWLHYCEAKPWLVLADLTRRQRQNIMIGVLKQSGDIAAARITTEKIIDGRDSRSPSMGRHFVNTMRGLFSWAAAAKLVPADPTKGVEVKKPPTDGFAIWTDEEIDRFQAFYPLGTRERLAFDVLFYTGLRKSDAVVVGRQHLKGGILTIKTQKTGETVSIRVMPELARSIAAGPTSLDMAFIAHGGGRKMTPGSFGVWFRRVCTAAGCPGSAHGLRKALATRLANRGATEKQLEALFGWRGGGMASLYTRKADRARLADAAMDLMEQSPNESSPNPEGRLPNHKNAEEKSIGKLTQK